MTGHTFSGAASTTNQRCDPARSKCTLSGVGRIFSFSAGLSWPWLNSEYVVDPPGTVYVSFDEMEVRSGGTSKGLDRPAPL